MLKTNNSERNIIHPQVISLVCRYNSRMDFPKVLGGLFSHDAKRAWLPLRLAVELGATNMVLILQAQESESYEVKEASPLSKKKVWEARQGQRTNASILLIRIFIVLHRNKHLILPPDLCEWLFFYSLTGGNVKLEFLSIRWVRKGNFVLILSDVKNLLYLKATCISFSLIVSFIHFSRVFLKVFFLLIFRDSL